MELVSRSAAKAQLLRTYFTGKACPNGHVAERYTSTGNCIECQANHTRKRNADPKMRERAREAYRLRASVRQKQNVKPPSARKLALERGDLMFDGRPCDCCNSTLRYTKSSMCVACLLAKQSRPDIKAYKRAYNEKHRDRLAKIRSASYEERRSDAIERARRWAAENPDKRRAIAVGYKARRKAVVSSGDSTRDIATWIASAKKICYWCDTACVDGFHVDHYVPLAKGGKHEISNLVIACPRCNLTKNAKDPYRFAASVGRLF